MKKNSKSNSNANAKFGLLQNKLFQSSLIVFVLLVGAGFFLSQSTGLFAKALPPAGTNPVYTGTIIFSDDFKYHGQLITDSAGIVTGWGEYVTNTLSFPIVMPGKTCDIVGTVCASQRFYTNAGVDRAQLPDVDTVLIRLNAWDGTSWVLVPWHDNIDAGGVKGLCAYGTINAYTFPTGMIRIDARAGGHTPVSDFEPFPASYAALSYRCWGAFP